MTAGREHILVMPNGFFGLRIAQLVLSVILLALGGFGIGAYGISYDGVDLILFTSIACLIITIYNLVAMTKSAALYNYWAILALDIFAVVFWIISFSLLASEVAGMYYTYSYSCTYYYGYCYKKRDLAKRYVGLEAYRDVMAVTSALGGVQFVLFTVSLVLTGLALNRHRAAGGHCMPGAAAGTTPQVSQPQQQAYPPEQQQYPPQQQQYPPQPAQQQYPPQQPVQQQYPPQPQYPVDSAA